MLVPLRSHVQITFSWQNGGSHLCAVDDSNDHVLSVWDWQKEERLADVKVRSTTHCGVPQGTLPAWPAGSRVAHSPHPWE